MALTLLLTWSTEVPIPDALTIAADQIERIRARTQSGLDSRGQPFQGYTPPPLRASDRAGKTKPRSGQSGPVDLTDTGEMLASLAIIEVSYTGALIGVVGPAADRAEAHQFGTGTLPERHWLGTTEEEQAQMDSTALRIAVLNFQGGKQ